MANDLRRVGSLLGVHLSWTPSRVRSGSRQLEAGPAVPVPTAVRRSPHGFASPGGRPRTHGQKRLSVAANPVLRGDLGQV
jgi:hypothetical protein